MNATDVETRSAKDWAVAYLHFARETKNASYESAKAIATKFLSDSYRYAVSFADATDQVKSLLRQRYPEELISEAAIEKTRLEDERPVVVQALESRSAPDSWPTLDRAALYGLAGDIVHTLEPDTEADPAAILFSLFAAFGSAVGGSPHFLTEADRQTGNLFVVLVGNSSSGRKGVSWGHVRRLMELADPDWLSRLAPGLSSGEGLIWAVRDPIDRQEAVKEKGRVVSYQSVIEDQGVTDKRLLAYQSEFASVLRILGRDGNTLSAIMREAWDRGDLGTLTKNSPARATGAHVSMLGHITKPELLKYMDGTEAANGWGNRILWPCVRRSKTLPEGGLPADLELRRLGKRLEDALAIARSRQQLRRDDAARRQWFDIYADLTRERVGLYGSITARAAAQVVRLSLIYALLDGSQEIGFQHQCAALAAWRYAEDSARYIFGEAMGDPTADRILEALRRSESGLTRTELRDVFAHHKSAKEIDRVLAALEASRIVERFREQSGGRPAECWRVK